jgi:shikimate kinase
VKVYLCGMIGSGKTTIGRPLAAAVGLPFYDLDDEMDKTLGYSFHTLVREQGWLAFRELEYSICRTFARHKSGIFCLGGGTVRYQWNMDVLKGTGLIILLTAPMDVLIDRVRAADRPRVNEKTTLEEDIRLLWHTHKDTYYNAADIRYESDKHNIAQEVDELKAIILQWYRPAPVHTS